MTRPFASPIYEGWRESRFRYITHILDDDWRGKHVLELGGGNGDLGSMFLGLGARVTSVDARGEHIDMGRYLYPQISFIRRDLSEGCDGLEPADIVLDLGLIYHLPDPQAHLDSVAPLVRDVLLLESEVSDSEDQAFNPPVLEDASVFDQSVAGIGCRPSAAFLEKALGKAGFTFERQTSPRLNFEHHRYDWTPNNDGRQETGLRAFWLCKQNGL